MRHLVIGGAGFIGTNLAHHLLDSGESVTVLDDLSRRGAPLNARWLQQRHPGMQLVQADIRNADASLLKLVQETDVVHHLAAQVAVTASVDDPRTDFDINLSGTLNVLEAVRQAGTDPIVLFASTNKVYGQMQNVPIEEHRTRYAYKDMRAGVSEDQPLDFHSPYACSKGGADQYVHDYSRVFGVRTVVFRQSCIYGPHQFGIEDQGWLAWFTIATTLGRPLTIYGTGKQVRDVLNVSDLISAFQAAIERIDVASGKIYNLGGGPDFSLSLLEAIDLIGESLATPVPHSFAAARPGDQMIYVSDIRKAAEELGWRPRIDPQVGVGELVTWITSNRDLFVSSY